MSVYKLNQNNTTTKKIELLNDMIIETDGKITSAKFDKNELDQLFNDLGLNRKYKRNVGIGNTESTYTRWTHIKAEDGYSIWKYTPDDYTYDSNNKLYFDGKVLENRGEADSESATAFDLVYLYDGSTYTDNTSEASTEGGTEFDLMSSTSDYLYLGLSTTFKGVKFEFQTRGSNYTLKVEYYGASGWTQLTANDNDLEDNTSNFESDGRISWDLPSDWTTTDVNGQTKYWIRISTTSTPVTTAKAYYIIPGNSVIGLLALSSSQFLNEEWAWCGYGGSIYVTIRNTGDSAYEGNYYITSSSSDTNKKNFFVYNHQYTADYKDSTYSSAFNITTKTADYTITNNDRIILVDASSNSVNITLPSASGYKGRLFTIKVLTIGGGYSATVTAQSGETIDGSNTYSFSSDYDFITVASDNSNWYIIAK